MHPKLKTLEVLSLEEHLKERMFKHPPKHFDFGPLEVLHWASINLTPAELELLRDIERECGWEVSNKWWLDLLTEADRGRESATQEVAQA